MADEFIVDSLTAEAIKVRHKPSAHRFTFHVFEQTICRTLRAGWIQANENTSIGVDGLKAVARAFAEREARAAWLID